MAEAKTAQKTKVKSEKTDAPKPSPRADKKSDKLLYAIIAIGGKQYRVQSGDKIKIEKLPGKHKEGDKIIFDKVLMVDDGETEATIGTPFIKEAYVQAILNKIGRYKTIDVIKYKQKSRYFKKYGHRQPYFEVKIDLIK
jgi:large subunit ribosomal protein L21